MESKRVAYIAGTAKSSDAIGKLNWSDQLAKLGKEGFLIRSTTIAGNAVIVVASETEIGAMYGAFHLLGLMQTGRPIDKLEYCPTSETSAAHGRPLGQSQRHDRERGYAGRSLWQWSELPDKLSPRYADYARAQRLDWASMRWRSTTSTPIFAFYQPNIFARSPRWPTCSALTAFACIFRRISPRPNDSAA